MPAAERAARSVVLLDIERLEKLKVSETWECLGASRGQ